MKDEKQEVRVLFGFVTDHDGGRATLRVVGRFVHYTDGQVRNISGWDDRGLADLALSCYVASDGWGEVALADQYPYGWACEYRQRYSVGLADAKAMVATLGKVERHLGRLRASGDYPESFHTWARVVAKLLGATSFGWHVGPVPRGAWSHDQFTYRWGGATDLYQKIRGEWQAAAGLGEQEQAS
jgi:hypothetical protein